MNSPARLCSLLLSLCLGSGLAFAEEKNGIMLTAAKKTIERSDSRSLSYRNIDRIQALKVTVKNTSFKDMPESELLWTFLIKGYYSTPRKKVIGREPVKLLRASESIDIICGNVPITGYRDSSEVKKTDFDYQLIITQGGKEMIRLESTSNFETIAKTITNVEEFDSTAEPETTEAARRKKMRGKEMKDEPVEPAEEDKAKEADDAKEPETKPLPPAAKPTPKPAKEEPASPSGGGVDFFNLNK